MTDLILYHTERRRAVITLNRPKKRNALNPEMVKALGAAFDRAEADAEAKVVILKANGAAFCAGADLAYLQQLQQFSEAENLADSRALSDLFVKIYQFPKLVLAQVHGHALAGGAGLVTVCDLACAAAGIQYGYTEVKIGFVPALVSVFLVKKIGEARAASLLLSGVPVSAEEAARLGVLHEVVPSDALDNTVNELADLLITQNSGQAMQLTKRLLQQVQDLPLSEALELAAKTNTTARATNDCKKGISAFLNKEKINW